MISLVVLLREQEYTIVTIFLRHLTIVVTKSFVKNPDLTVGVSPQLKLRLSRILLALMFDVALDHRLIDTNRRHKVTV